MGDALSVPFIVSWCESRGGGGGERGSNKPSPQSLLQIKQLFSFEKGKCYRPYHVVGFERRFLTLLH